MDLLNPWHLNLYTYKGRTPGLLSLILPMTSVWVPGCACLRLLSNKSCFSKFFNDVANGPLVFIRTTRTDPATTLALVVKLPVWALQVVQTQESVPGIPTP